MILSDYWDTPPSIPIYRRSSLCKFWKISNAWEKIGIKEFLRPLIINLPSSNFWNLELHIWRQKKLESHEIPYKTSFSEYSFSIYLIDDSILYRLSLLCQMLSYSHHGEVDHCRESFFRFFFLFWYFFE